MHTKKLPDGPQKLATCTLHTTVPCVATQMMHRCLVLQRNQSCTTDTFSILYKNARRVHLPSRILVSSCSTRMEKANSVNCPTAGSRRLSQPTVGQVSILGGGFTGRRRREGDASVGKTDAFTD